MSVVYGKLQKVDATETDGRWQPHSMIRKAMVGKEAR